MGLNSGKNALLKKDGTAIANMSSFNLTIANQTIDAIVFGTGWVNCIDSVQGWSASISGFMDVADTTGQVELHDAAMAHDEVTGLTFYINAGDFYAGNCFIESFNITADNNNIVSFDMSLKGNGAITFTNGV